MRCEVSRLTADTRAKAAELRALVPAPGEVAEAVAEIIESVRNRRDEALAQYTRELDTQGSDPPPLTVAETELDEAVRSLEPTVRNGLEAAIANVRRVAEATLTPHRRVELGDHAVTVREAPVERAAVYVPGGRAPYPSTAVMGVVTARVAGVKEVAVCSPPGTRGEIHPALLAASRLAGASIVYRMGGAQAIAALAHGTETVAPVDVLVGPGNLYVQEAKRQVSGRVGIDGFAGPSDLVVIAADEADRELVELDLLAQAEHGPGTLVITISTSTELLNGLKDRLENAPDTGAVAALVAVRRPAQALELAQALAPEHLQLMGASVEIFAPQVTRAGCVFVGADAGTAFGDYIAGSNHILPTGGSARFGSALSAAHFRRRFYEVAVRDPAPLAQKAAPIARAEGFELHARSMEARIGHNGPTSHP